MSGREVCQRCHYPKSVCLCAYVKPIETDVKVWILQHPSEQKAAKNTAHLVDLVMPSCRVVVGEHPNDFANIRSHVENELAQTLLLYPSENSQPLHPDSEKPVPSIKNLLLLDGTWRKAYKMWKLNPWLHKVSTYHLETKLKTNYSIRKSSVDGSFSTLEAVALSLPCLTDLDPRPLHQLLEMRMEVFQRHRK